MVWRRVISVTVGETAGAGKFEESCRGGGRGGLVVEEEDASDQGGLCVCGRELGACVVQRVCVYGMRRPSGEGGKVPRPPSNGSRFVINESSRILSPQFLFFTTTSPLKQPGEFKKGKHIDLRRGHRRGMQSCMHIAQNGHRWCSPIRIHSHITTAAILERTRSERERRRSLTGFSACPTPSLSMACVASMSW